MSKVFSKILSPLSMLFWLIGKIKDKAIGYISVSIIRVIVSVPASFIVIIFPKLILDELTGNQDIKNLISYVIALVFLSLFCTLVEGLIGKYLNNKNFVLSNYFDFLVFEKTYSVDFPYLENAELLNKRQFALENFSNVGGLGGTLQAFWTIISNFFTVFGLLYIVFSVDLFIPLVLFAIQIIITLIENISKKKTYTYIEKNTENNKWLSYLLYLIMDYKYAKDIKLFEMQELFNDKFIKRRDNSQKIFRKRASVDFGYSTLKSVLSTAQILFVYIVLISKFFQNDSGFTIGDFYMVVSALLSFKNKFGSFLSGILTIKYNTKYIEAIKSFFEMPSIIKKGEKSIPTASEYCFTFENVTFTYPGSENVVLDNISCTINNSEKVAIVGLNGSGKSTFIKLLLRLYEPNSGRILLNGVDIREYDYDEYHSVFSVIFQDFEILPFSLEENIMFDCVDNEGLNYAIERADIKDRIERLSKGSKTYVRKLFDEDGVEFSGGELQKIAIARSIYNSGDVYIFDEPTSAFDPKAEEEFFLKFNEITNKKTTIFISHRLSSCCFCDKIIVFDDKHIVQQGSHEQLIKEEGRYVEMFNAQAKHYISENAV